MNTQQMIEHGFEELKRRTDEYVNLICEVKLLKIKIKALEASMAVYKKEIGKILWQLMVLVSGKN